MRRIILLLAVAAVDTACNGATAPRVNDARTPDSPFLESRSGGSVDRTNESVVYDHLTPSCDGGTVHVYGTAHVVSTVTTAGNTATLRFHFNTEDVTGTGVTSGVAYQFVEVYREDGTVTFADPQIDETFVGHYRLVSRGSLQNYLLDATYDIGYDPATQTPRYTVVKLSSRCRG